MFNQLRDFNLKIAHMG